MTESTSETNVLIEQGESEFSFAVAYVAALLEDDKPDIYCRVIEEIDRHVLHTVMTHYKGNNLKAAERLGISRMTLRSKLRKLNMYRTKLS